MKIFKKFENYILKKACTQTHSFLETLSEASCIINPQFITVDDFVFLDCGNKDLCYYNCNGLTESEKIEIEALENHIHLFYCVNKHFRKYAKKISISIAQNLSNTLKHQFPQKEFVVLLELNFKNSIILRFHQIRNEEDIYMDPKYYGEQYDNGTFILFK